MIVSGANLTALFTSWDVVFNRAFAAYPSYWSDISTVTRSASKRQEYPWLKRTIAMREWLGERVLQALEVNDFSIVNKHFEATEEISRDDLEDDLQGVYEPMISELGRITAVHPDLMIFGTIRAALASIDNPSGAAYDMAGLSIPVPVCYDGVTLFSADGHPVGKAGATTPVPNIVTSGGSNPYWVLVDASRAVRPFLFQIRKPYEAVHMVAPTDEWVFNKNSYRYGVDGRDAAGPGLWQLVYASNADLTPDNFGAAKAAMREIKNDNGLPFGAWSGASQKQRYLVVPPALEDEAERLLHQEWGPGEGALAATPQKNIFYNTAQLIVSEYLSI